MDARASRHTGRDRATWLVVGVAGALALVAVGLAVGDRMPAMDRWALDTFRVAPGGAAETAVATVSDGIRLVSVAAVVAAVGWMLWRGRRRSVAPAIGYTALFLVLVASSELLKDVFARPHPTDPTDVSYPSTHVAMVTVATVIVASILTIELRRSLAVIVLTVAAVVVVTAATRVLLGEHHLTDVVGTALGYTGLTLLGTWASRKILYVHA